MMRSKTVELFLALGLSATLVACNSGGSSPEAGEGDESAPTRVESQQKSNEGGEGGEGDEEKSPQKSNEGGEGGEGDEEKSPQKSNEGGEGGEG